MESKEIVLKRLRSQNTNIDQIDHRLLLLLADDARMTVAKLARAVHLSPPSVAERIRRLEDSGIIEGYTLLVNPTVLNLPIAAWLRVRPLPGQLQKVAKLLQELPEIVECDRVTGEDCFLARAQVRDVTDLERLIDKIIGNAMTNTSIIQSSPVRRRLPPIKLNLAT